MSGGRETLAVKDPGRLALLGSLGLLDTAPEAAFDDIVAAASALCDTPIALVSLVDERRQWFKAKVGLDVGETPVEQAVCAYTLDRTELLVIPDLAVDRRTRANPLVTGAPHIRFYAGAPLRASNGHVLGSLCVIDTAPRPTGLTQAQRRGLEALGRQVMNVISLRRRVLDRETMLIANQEERKELTARAHGIDAAHAAGQIGTFELDVALNTIRISDEFREIYGLPEDSTPSVPFLESLIVEEDEALISHEDTRGTGTASLNVVYRIRRASDGAVRWVSRKASFEREAGGRPLRMFGAVQDVTEQAVINLEIGHRLKNMLAMVMALAAQTLKGVSDREPVRAFEKRLVALGVAHDALLTQFWVAAPLSEIVSGVIGLLGQAARVETDGPMVTLGPKAALGLSLLVHELTTNAMKHGALSEEGGRAILHWRVDTQASEPVLVVEWREEGGPPVARPARKGFGSRLISLGIMGTGDATVSYLQSGLQARFAAPLAKAQNL